MVMSIAFKNMYEYEYGFLKIIPDCKSDLLVSNRSK